MQPFVTRIQDGDPNPLTLETRTERQHLNCVTVVQGSHVVQVGPHGIEESRGPIVGGDHGALVCLTFDTEDGCRFFRLYDYRLGAVTVTTSRPQRAAPWEDNPELGIVPPRLGDR